jgi:hypothetical protein
MGFEIISFWRKNVCKHTRDQKIVGNAKMSKFSKISILSCVYVIILKITVTARNQNRNQNWQHDITLSQSQTDYVKQWLTITKRLKFLKANKLSDNKL